MCGFIGVFDPSGAQVAPSLYDGLMALQHRGQDSAGIITFDGNFHVKKGQGLVRDFIEPRHFERLRGAAGLAHVRYPTIGSNTEVDAQPFEVYYPYGIAMAHNGNVANYHRLREEIATSYGRHVNSQCDVEVILNVFAHKLAEIGTLDDDAICEAVRFVFEKARGAYSCVALIANYGLVAFRDPSGIKPFAVGTRQTDKGTSWAFASESVAFGLMGYDHQGDLAPGEVAIIREGSTENPTRRVVTDIPHTPCIFEHVYFARPDSVIDGITVHQARVRMGEKLADKVREADIPVDVIVPVPDSARNAAYAMAERLDIPFSEALVKNRYVGRTFIMPNQEERRSGIRSKLTPIESELKGKHVLLLDDSIVRGNTSAQIIEMVRGCGAKSVSFASYSPPIRYPCVYGVDMSRFEEFVAHKRDVEEIREILGCDHLIYQELDAMVAAANEAAGCNGKFCDACFTGNYPVGDINKQDFDNLAADRDRGEHDLPFWVGSKN